MPWTKPTRLAKPLLCTVAASSVPLRATLHTVCAMTGSGMSAGEQRECVCGTKAVGRPAHKQCVRLPTAWHLVSHSFQHDILSQAGMDGQRPAATLPHAQAGAR